jgi:hypothetical protein
VEEIEKPPYEINDNTDDVMEPRPAAIAPPSVRSSKVKRDGLIYNAYQEEDALGNSMRSQRKQGTGNAQTYRGDPQ